MCLTVSVLISAQVGTLLTMLRAYQVHSVAVVNSGSSNNTPFLLSYVNYF
jgi:hypothetical protein